MKINTKIGVVVPVYQCEKIIDELCKRLILNLSKITEFFEVILVDDSSSDNSWLKIKENNFHDKRIKGYLLSMEELLRKELSCYHNHLQVLCRYVAMLALNE